MALSTKDLQEGGASVKKTIAPGNHTLKINSLNLEKFKFVEDAYHLILNVETEPLKDFEGFLVDPNNPDGDRYAGQVGRVKTNRYAYADGETRSGFKVNRDRSILIFIKSMCKALDVAEDSDTFTNWFTNEDGKHETIESFVEAFDNKIQNSEKVYLDFAIGGREWENKNGYINYDMFLLKPMKGTFAFGEPGSNKIMTYNEKDPKHLIPLKIKDVESFGDEDISIPSNTSGDFSLD
tara:strand:+ start:1505 stop:2215 length:711 start_codon:yes stop_codon:yes gene_type:complete